MAYYVGCLLVYMGFYYGTAKLFHTTNLGAAIAVTYGMLFLATPALVALLMRLSLLKWYVDPLAAALVPLFLYGGMIHTQMNRAGVAFGGALLRVNESLCTDGGSGWLFLGGLYLFGLAASFSVARKNGESFAWRLLEKRIGKPEEQSEN